MKRIDFRSPYTCMVFVILMYVVKISLKLWAGLRINSISIYGDAVHNIADIIEAIFLLLVLYIAKRPETSKYPVGKSSIESVGSLLIGLVILVLGVGFLLKSVLGILAYFSILPFLSFLLQYVVEVPPQIDFGSSAAIVITVIGLSVVLSWAIAWYEINTGRSKKHPSLVADGKETLMDSFVELAILIGIVGSFFGMYYLDFFLGVVVAGAMLHTAYTISRDSLANLLHKSVDQKYLDRIKSVLSRTKGVEGFRTQGSGRIKAFKLGKFIFVSIRIYVSPAMDSEGVYLLKKGINSQVEKLMPQFEIKIYLRVNVVPEEPRRAIIPVCNSMHDPLDAYIADDFRQAKSYYIADLKGDRIVTVHEEKNRYRSVQELAEFIRRKRVAVVYTVKEEKALQKLLPGTRFEHTHFLVFRDMFH